MLTFVWGAFHSISDVKLHMLTVGNVCLSPKL